VPTSIQQPSNQLSNDSYIPTIGTRNPRTLGGGSNNSYVPSMIGPGVNNSMNKPLYGNTNVSQTSIIDQVSSIPTLGGNVAQ
jgi:hypothetical protein